MDFDSEILEKETGLDLDNDSDPPLAHKAAAAGDVPLLVQAIRHDPGLIQQKDSEGLTPLAHAVQSQQLHAVKRLVKMGADINSQDASGRTSLAVAAYQGWNDGVVYLLRKGATQTISDKSGRTPLHASTYDNDPKTLLSLLQRLAYTEINQTDNERMSALHWAAFHNRPEHLRHLLQRGAEILSQDVDGKTALHWAAQNGCRNCCVLLAEHDPESGILQCTDNSGKTAIHFAAAAGHHLILQDLSRFLPDLFEAEDQDDRTPLHWAAAMGHAECVRTLLKLGVSPNPVDIDGGSPLEYAKQAGHKECSELLEERLGLRKFNSETDRDKNRFSSKNEKSNKGAVGFFKGLFSKKEKQPQKETQLTQSKIQLPALDVGGQNGIGSYPVGALDYRNLPVNERPKKGISNQTVGARERFVDCVQENVTASVNRLSIDAHIFDDNDNVDMKKPKKHRRKKKKERHKRFGEDGSSPSTLKTESSITDDHSTYNTNVRSMHLSPLAGNVHTASLSPRASNSNHESVSSKRLGELNPIRAGKLLNDIQIPLPTTLATLRMDRDGRSRSPTPPPVLSLNTKKALPDISPLVIDDEESVKRRLRQKYREVVNESYFDSDSDSHIQW